MKGTFHKVDYLVTYFILQNTVSTQITAYPEDLCYSNISGSSYSSYIYLSSPIVGVNEITILFTIIFNDAVLIQHKPKF